MTRRPRAMSVLVAGLFCVSAGVPSSSGAQLVVAAGSAAPSEPTGLIAFSTGFILVNPDESGTAQVFTVHPDGTEERQLTHVPDGSQAGDPDISPDGRTIAYVSNEGGNYAVWQMHVDGTDQHQRHGQVGFDYFTPRWSPDSSRLVVTKCDNRLLSFACDLVVVRPDGTERTLISNERVNRDPTWSPSGRFVAFDSDRGGYLSTVSVVRSSGGRPHRITPPDLEGFWPSWAPGGRRLVVSSNFDRPISQVFRLGRHGSGLRQLTHLGAQGGGFASYSPDGRWIVLISNQRDGVSNDLYVMRADGSDLRLVVSDHPDVALSDWGVSAS